MPAGRTGVAGVLGAAVLAIACLACGPGGAGPHVVLISIDTLRADHLGVYGYERETTPRLDAFFGEGTVFENATSPAPCTIPAVRQFLAGGFDHREDRSVLAELLREQGYGTAAFVSQQQFYRGPETYRRGFGHFDIQGEDEVNPHGGSARVASEVTDRALAWLEANAGEPRLFLWLHYFDPHDPYTPPAEHRVFDSGGGSQKRGDPRHYLKQAAPGGKRALFRDAPRGFFSPADVARFVDLYDAEIRYTDAEIGRALDGLERHGILDDSVVVLVADHGEWLGERDRWFHCLTLRDEEVRVPLLFRVNGGRLTEVARDPRAASTLDVLPTLAGLLGIAIPADAYHGVDLRQPHPGRVVASMWSGLLAVRDREWKLGLSNGVPQTLYWTARDPEERWNRLGDEKERGQALISGAAPYRALQEELRAEKIEEALRAVGYIH